ncbi:hypothetical protein TcWFU_009458 [Taenia crassiceps]|uniref:Uncharacterized protein n=1 Tax=Taenia crassiceps TaxID=6207 RepID=A0ABR4QC29_9CEST
MKSLLTFVALFIVLFTVWVDVKSHPTLSAKDLLGKEEEQKLAEDADDEDYNLNYNDDDEDYDDEEDDYDVYIHDDDEEVDKHETVNEAGEQDKKEEMFCIFPALHHRVRSVYIENIPSPILAAEKLAVVDDKSGVSSTEESKMEVKLK